MKRAYVIFLGLLASCTSDSFPVADFEVSCSSLDSASVSSALTAFAKRHDLTIDLQESSESYLRLRMDGSGFGQDIFVEYRDTDSGPETSNCSTAELPCLDVTAFAGGTIPEDELSENTATQTKTASALKSRLEGLCEV